MFFRNKTASFNDLSFAKDYHCHLLPGVDDGVDEMKASVQILQHMNEMGVHDVVLTPHINPEIYPGNTEQSLRERFGWFMSELPNSVSESMHITLGGEYMLVGGFEQRNPKDLLQMDSGKVLVEMSYYYISPVIEKAIFNLMMAGITPVIAHPERYVYLADSLSTLDRYHDMGATFQLNLFSLSGIYGPGSIRILEYLKQKGWYSYMGSDTHSIHHFDSMTKMKFPKRYL